MSTPEPIRLTCTGCAASYKVHPDALKRGQVLNCRRCGASLGEARSRPEQPVSEDLILAWLSEPQRDEET